MPRPFRIVAITWGDSPRPVALGIADWRAHDSGYEKRDGLRPEPRSCQRRALFTFSPHSVLRIIPQSYFNLVDNLVSFIHTPYEFEFNILVLHTDRWQTLIRSSSCHPRTSYECPPHCDVERLSFPTYRPFPTRTSLVHLVHNLAHNLVRHCGPAITHLMT